MPMPDPTGDPAKDYGFFTPRRTTYLLLTIAVVALVLAAIALVVALQKTSTDPKDADGNAVRSDRAASVQVAECRPRGKVHLPPNSGIYSDSLRQIETISWHLAIDHHG